MGYLLTGRSMILSDTFQGPVRDHELAWHGERPRSTEIRSCVARGESFALETTLSGLRYLRHIRAWKAQGYRVSLYFLALPSVEAAMARVADRVRQGGHDIPQAVIRRRFAAGLHNFESHYQTCVDVWARYDNAGSNPVSLEWSENT